MDDIVERALSSKDAGPSGSTRSAPAPSAPSGEPLTVFLTSAGRIKKATWVVGGDWVALDALYWRTFASTRASKHWAGAALGSGARAPLPKELFMLRDREYGIFYEDFDLEDLYDGAVIEVMPLPTCSPALVGSPVGGPCMLLGVGLWGSSVCWMR
jgi:hypothetical protein